MLLVTDSEITKETEVAKTAIVNEYFSNLTISMKISYGALSLRRFLCQVHCNLKKIGIKSSEN